MKASLELKRFFFSPFFFSAPKRALFRFTSIFRERLPVRPVLALCVRAKMGELIHLSAMLTYASARCGWDSSAETIGRASRGSSKT